MATRFDTISKPMTILEKIRARADAEAAELRAKSEFQKKVIAARAKFVAKYGKTPENYVLDAKKAAYGTSSEAGGYAGRSASGKHHTEKAPQDKVTKGDIKAYHDLEEAGKACAKKGDVGGAITKYEEALQKRIDHETKHSKVADAGHERAKTMLRERRNSLVGLKNLLDTTNPGVVAAKLEVKTFFLPEGITYNL
jgi:hypothetical protein